MDIEPDALELLARARWKGNVRELRNVLEQALMRMDEGGVVTRALLADLVTEPPPSEANPSVERRAAAASPAEIRPLKETLAAVEREAIRQALAATGGVRSKAAKLLGISRAQFYQKLANLGLTD